MGLNGVGLGYPTSTNLPRVDGLSTDPRALRLHTHCICNANVTANSHVTYMMHTT